MSNNTSGHPGVYFNKPTQKWMAYFRENGRMYYLGLYDTLEDAANIRDMIVSDSFGDFFRDTTCPQVV
jgi:hypothetical protein